MDLPKVISLGKRKRRNPSWCAAVRIWGSQSRVSSILYALAPSAKWRIELFWRARVIPGASVQYVDRGQGEERCADQGYLEQGPGAGRNWPKSMFCSTSWRTGLAARLGAGSGHLRRKGKRAARATRPYAAGRSGEIESSGIGSLTDPHTSIRSLCEGRHNPRRGPG